MKQLIDADFYVFVFNILIPNQIRKIEEIYENSFSFYANWADCCF